jgi:hypothetical protein
VVLVMHGLEPLRHWIPSGVGAYAAHAPALGSGRERLTRFGMAGSDRIWERWCGRGECALHAVGSVQCSYRMHKLLYLLPTTRLHSSSSDIS